jgi:hypothetical protein
MSVLLMGALQVAVGIMKAQYYLTAQKLQYTPTQVLCHQNN